MSELMIANFSDMEDAIAELEDQRLVMQEAFRGQTDMPDDMKIAWPNVNDPKFDFYGGSGDVAYRGEYHPATYDGHIVAVTRPDLQFGGTISGYVDSQDFHHYGRIYEIDVTDAGLAEIFRPAESLEKGMGILVAKTYFLLKPDGDIEFSDSAPAPYVTHRSESGVETRETIFGAKRQSGLLEIVGASLNRTVGFIDTLANGTATVIDESSRFGGARKIATPEDVNPNR